MEFTRAGIILYTQKYSECVSFYSTALNLNILFKIDRPDEQLTCFELGGIYLMVEIGGCSHDGTKPVEHCPTKFRFNVADINAACIELENKGVDVKIRHHEWGTTAEFSDPDGNPCALRSDKGFGV